MEAVLAFGFGLQLDLAVGEFDGILDAFAVEFFADLLGLFLDECGEGVEVSVDVLACLFLCSDQRVVEAFHLLALVLIYAVQREGLRMGVFWRGSRGGGGVANAIRLRVLGLVFFLGPDALNRKKGILRAAVAFFANAGLLAPEVGVDRVTLRHFVVAEALGEIHASAVGELAQQREHLPLDVAWRLLGGIAEIN